MAELHLDAFGANEARVEALQLAINDLRRFSDELFARWTTLDDLHDVIIKLLSPTPERERYLAAKYPPPQSWYDETDDPFSTD